MRRLIFILLVALMLAVAALIAVGEYASAPVLRSMGEPPSDLSIEPVTVSARSGEPVKGWYMAGEEGRGIVILLHGIRSDRRSLLGRARFLSRAGHAVLMIDLQAHGESAGERITFGHLEARSVEAAVGYARRRLPAERRAIIGQSLGGAASVLSDAPLEVDAFVLEAVYSNLREAVGNRLAIRLGEIGRYLAPALLWQVGWRLGIDPDELSPVNKIDRLGAPVFIIAGGKDMRTTPQNARDLFHHARQPKTMWVLENAGHQDFHRFAPEEYERRILAFLKRYISDNE